MLEPNPTTPQPPPESPPPAPAATGQATQAEGDVDPDSSALQRGYSGAYQPGLQEGKDGDD